MGCVGEEGEVRVVRRSQTKKCRGEMNLTDTVDLTTESGLTGEEGEELEKGAEGRFGGGSGGNLEEEVELVVGDPVFGYDR
jgi:hypothetical protein